MMIYLRPFALLCWLVLLAACGSTPAVPQVAGTMENQPPGSSVEQLLKKAGSGQSEKAQRLRLAAAERAFEQGDITAAADTLGQIMNKALPLDERMQAVALMAELALAQGHNQSALELLDQLGAAYLDTLPVKKQTRYQRIRALVLEANAQTLQALRVRLYIAPLLEESETPDNDEAIWRLTKQLAPSVSELTGDNVLDGWLKLARTYSGAGQLLYQQQDAIRTFVQSNPEHPAARKLPSELSQLLEQQSQVLPRIALLLPQEGSLAAVGQALRDGFIAAQQQALAEDGQAPALDLYDSNQMSDMDEFYQRAKAAGAFMVIGPLEKPLVRQLAMREQLPLPTLALNYADGQNRGPADLFQFGLAAEDEAREVARRAAADGMRRAVVMVPKSKWGDRVLEVFRQSWNAEGGELVAVEYIDQPIQINDQVAHLLRRLGSRRPARPSDFLFLAATPQQAQQIKPTLAYHGATNLPVYATSHLYGGDLSAQQMHDLEGIVFCETPWLLGMVDDPLHQQISRVWPQANSSLGRLYAMGIDAFRLASRLSGLKEMAGSSYEGFSGDLSLDGNLRIVRKLPWATFKNGQIQRLSEEADRQPIVPRFDDQHQQ